MSDKIRVQKFTNKLGTCSQTVKTCDDCFYEDTDDCDFTELEVTDNKCKNLPNNS